MATYNGAEFINEQLQSIEKQTYPIFELVVIDDASTDTTIEKVERFNTKNPVRIIRHQANLGVNRSFQEGIQQSKGDFIALVDQDDIWEPNRLSETVKSMKQLHYVDRPCLVYSDLSIVDRSGRTTSKSFWTKAGKNAYAHNFETFTIGNPVLGCTSLMNRKLAKYADTIPANCPLHHDGWLALAAFTFGETHAIQQPLVRYRQHDRNVTFPASKNRFARLNRYFHFVRHLVSPGAFMINQLITYGLFLKQYEALMSPEQQTFVKNFLSLTNRSFPRKRNYVLETIRKNPCQDQID